MPQSWTQYERSLRLDCCDFCGGDPVECDCTEPETGEPCVLAYDYRGHLLVADGTDAVRVMRDGVKVDWIRLPGRGLFRAMREAMRIVREEHPYGPPDIDGPDEYLYGV
jgi:hypothetical protein